ncbi:hypothetical protein HMPREF0762_00797 [Slackia exigua ATCC 700122]|uniref:Uncharacterized protein n=1 Tax=Slackia exigua (strain ATCC 700122 / DSM 15923 / CIP 105133 / JCM 11022 / KCTC 5966 / S-7) TaxID=649764 RepID=D0WG46_SLAES|nr:hypothetical protein HMPREF0762_00797 [Slackia exigua ATCC 700122]
MTSCARRNALAYREPLPVKKSSLNENSRAIPAQLPKSRSLGGSKTGFRITAPI